ncbi:hypothetical protein HYPSUDRAFT_64809 [Hypholoma sublateritium FD-334 SS-4]|uniref:Carbohydrate-binding module family 50 protein n=1 Tax=Hypholoma sublateritium (strain FD-334 SS-4) TaxID=945553 RepID=A0A0D2MMR7_HYPSF|nr:hypothetical protein HYPSUDRAFT_64809 [Hypholoma sublateritium FD-334 SS-4]
MTSRWTQHEEDSCRLPEGFRRIGYDADTRRYLFKDKHGALYQGEPGAEYGTMKPFPKTTSAFERSRPSAFSSSDDEDSPISPPAETIPKTFEDILPPELITTSTLSGYSRPSEAPPGKATRDKFKESVRRTALPKMHNVVTNLRRSVTSMRKPRVPVIAHSSQHRGSYDDEDTRRLVRPNSAAYMALDRSSSVAMSDTSGMPDSASAISVDTTRHYRQ